MRRLLIAGGFATWAAWASGCASGPDLTSPEAAEAHAVALANEKCQQSFHARPFKAGQYPASFSENRWSWGKMDPSGVHGYSALVSFARDRSDPQVEVFFSMDDTPLGEDTAPDSASPPGPDAPLDRDP